MPDEAELEEPVLILDTKVVLGRSLRTVITTLEIMVEDA